MAVSLPMATGVDTLARSSGTPEASAAMATSGGSGNVLVARMHGMPLATVRVSASSRTAGASPCRYWISLSPKISTRPGRR